MTCVPMNMVLTSPDSLLMWVHGRVAPHGSARSGGPGTSVTIGPGGFLRARRRLGEQPPEHHRQDSPVSVALGFGRAIDPDPDPEDGDAAVVAEGLNPHVPGP